MRQLEAFVAVADTRSFRLAGERLHLTASAISQVVAELEEQVGFRLFDRTTRSVAIAAAGQELIGPALAALRQMQLAQAAALDVRHRASGIVRVAAPLVLAGMVLPQAIAGFHAQRPRVRVWIRDVAVDQLVHFVSEGQCDLAVGPQRLDRENVERTPLFSSPWVIWCARNHPLAAKEAVDWRDLRRHPLVAAGRDHERSLALMDMKRPLQERIEPVDVVENISTALGIAAAGLGVAFSPAYVGVLAFRLGLVMRPIVDPCEERQVCLYRPTERTLAPAAQGFLEYLEKWLVKWHRTEINANTRRVDRSRSLPKDSKKKR
jgi:DNA-binding transcriptional LysR family regulator